MPLAPAHSSPPPPASTTHPSKPPPSPSYTLPAASASVSTGLVVGVLVGSVVLLLALSTIMCICCMKRKRTRDEGQHYPPLTPQSQHKVDQLGVPLHQLQRNASALSDHGIHPMMPKPSPLTSIAPSRQSSLSSQYNYAQPPPPLPFIHSIGSGSNFSAAESLSKSSQALSLGFVKSTFSFEELMCATDGFSDANLLGSGGFGYVHRGLLANGKEVAVKQLKSGSRQGEREFQAELEIISRVHHKHLVSLVGYCITGTQRLLVYEFIPNNTLEFHLHGKGRPTMDWLTRMRIALGSAKGLAYLHEDCHPKIIHRDIKAANILLDFKFEAKVADFGLAKISSESNTHVSTRVMGNFGYLAPEYASTGKLTDKSDVFSYGIMLLELITGKRPVDKNYSFTDSLVDWARPLLTHSLEENDFDSLVDPRLQNEFDRHEMARMVACAAACVCHSAKRRPRMSQVVRALEGDVSLSDLSEKIVPGNTTPYSSYDSSDYDPSQYKEDMKKFRKTALEGTHEYGASSGYSGTSDYGLYPSGSSSEAQSRRNTMEMNKLNRKGFSPGKS
ncbi:PREDICTED: proline-rich receptor-like protein kinase PERK1 [Lupinus angustifolius]|uniref:proline-rich receptor-like protein kinase PERK1 n=1 Tax=Lupinus angustifolius TaxID=3871 RepID=UPI00092F9B93|nr:PREDICTED: proline-rich receptor-like protein kinase PERK1 [Lupinus angustifolius]